MAENPARLLLLNFADHIVRQGRVVWSPDARIAIVDEYLEQARRAEQRADCTVCGGEITMSSPAGWIHVVVGAGHTPVHA